MKHLLSCVLVVALAGCASFRSYMFHASIDAHEKVSTAAYPAKPDDCVVEVFELEPIESYPPGIRRPRPSRFGEYGVDVDVSAIVKRPYDTLERFEMTGVIEYERLLDEARTLACRAGADALIFQALPRMGIGGDGMPSGWVPRARGWVVKFQ